jgi:hypothetical protein
MCNALCEVPKLGLDVLGKVFGLSLNDIRAQGSDGFMFGYLNQARINTCTQDMANQALLSQDRPPKIDIQKVCMEMHRLENKEKAREYLANLPAIPERSGPLHWRKPEDRP